MMVFSVTAAALLTVMPLAYAGAQNPAIQSESQAVVAAAISTGASNPLDMHAGDGEVVCR